MLGCFVAWGAPLPVATLVAGQLTLPLGHLVFFVDTVLGADVEPNVRRLASMGLLKGAVLQLLALPSLVGLYFVAPASVGVDDSASAAILLIAYACSAICAVGQLRQGWAVLTDVTADSDYDDDSSEELSSEDDKKTK